MSFFATCINNVKKLTALFHLLLMHFFFNLAESVLLNYASEQQTGECNKARYLIMAEQGPDILSHEGRIAKKSVDRWRRFKHRRAPKCAENHKFANGMFYTCYPLCFIPKTRFKLVLYVHTNYMHPQIENKTSVVYIRCIIAFSQLPTQDRLQYYLIR